MAGYRDNKGRFLPDHMNAQKAIDKGVADKYYVSKNYKGKVENAVATRTAANPYQFHHQNAPRAKEHKATGNPKVLESVQTHYKGKN